MLINKQILKIFGAISLIILIITLITLKVINDINDINEANNETNTETLIYDLGEKVLFIPNNEIGRITRITLTRFYLTFSDQSTIMLNKKDGKITKLNNKKGEPKLTE